MGKTKDHFKKIRDTKGTFHAKMDTIKERNGMDLTFTDSLGPAGKLEGPGPSMGHPFLCVTL